jgi:CRISPR/Cas system-associated protein Cas10 (large subunit of type III CRISPR-Cas system)
MDKAKPQSKTLRGLNPEQKQFIELQNQCALCGTELQIKVESYLEDYYLLEQAECPVCQIKTRQKNHRMH